MYYTLNSIHFVIMVDDLGFNGADLACICAEAAVKALERANPDLANCEHRDFPDINVTNIPVKLQDFDEAMRNIQSSSERMQEN